MVRIGIAGIGIIANDYLSLIENGQITGCEVTALSSRNVANMEQARASHGIEDAHLFTDYEEMLDSGLIDAVMICTPHALHPSMAIKAAERGIHVLIEKPIGVFTDEVRELLDVLNAHPEVKSGVLYNRRAATAFQKIHELVHSGALGKIKRASWLITNLYRPQAYHDSKSWRGTYRGEGGGLMLTQASHQLDLLLWTLGEPESVHAICGIGRERDIKVENEANLHLEYADGTTAQFIASSREFPGTNRLEISGSRAQAVLDDDRTLTIKTLEVDEREFSKTTSELFGRIPYTEETLHFDDADNSVQQAAIINNFIKAVEEGEPTLCPVKDALLSLQVINAAYLSSWNDGEGIALPLDAARYREAFEQKA